MTSLKFEKVITTKDKDILCNNFVYNYKNENKDLSKHFVCNKPGCYSSLTLLNDVKKIKAEESSANLKYIRITNGTFKRRNRCSKDVQRDLLIQKAKFDLVSYKIDVLEYLEEVCQTIHDKLQNKKSMITSSTSSTYSTLSTSTASTPFIFI